MRMFIRKDDGRLGVRSLDLQILFDELFMEAKNEKEVEWIYDNLETVLEITREEKLEDFEEEN